MSDAALLPESNNHLPSILFGAAKVLLPVALALIVAGLLLASFGKDPLSYYGYVIERGVFRATGIQASLTRMAPLLFIAAGLIVAFKAGLWNLGADGQFLLAAVCAAAAAPPLAMILPSVVVIALCFGLAFVVGAAWSIIPAYLKAVHGLNEIISSLMMSFLGVSLANVLIKIPFNDPTTTVPQTATVDVADRIGMIGNSTVHWGLPLGIITVIAVHWLMNHTSLGLKLQIVGANPRAALHAGLSLRTLTYVAFGLSAGLVGMGGAVDILGVYGNVRADWDPAYGILVIPLVFLARFNGWAVIGFVFFFAVLMIGGESAARRLGVPSYFVLVLVSLLMLFFALIEFADHYRKKRARS